MTIRLMSVVAALLLTAILFSACATSDPTPDPNSGTSISAATTATPITAAQAQNIALADAGLSAQDVTFLRTELERDNGRQYYDVQFYQDTTEYDYDIDARTGTILEKDTDTDNSIF